MVGKKVENLIFLFVDGQPVPIKFATGVFLQCRDCYRGHGQSDSRI
jgi:hypothetical protein